ncbi:MAG: DUF6797 domain-containing protein [Bacteroidota bacterium]
MQSKSLLFLLIASSFLIFQCGSADQDYIGTWDYEIIYGEDDNDIGAIEISFDQGTYQASIASPFWNPRPINDLIIQNDSLSGSFKLYGRDCLLKGQFIGEAFAGTLDMRRDDPFQFTAQKFIEDYQPIDRSNIQYLLTENDLSNFEESIDHAGMIANFDADGFERGERIYNSNCINCHGTPEIEGSIPLSKKFWAQSYKAGTDPYSMYQTLTKGYGSMPPQVTMTPQEKYDVIHYIREGYVREGNPSQYYKGGPKYLASLPRGKSTGPEPKPYHPWSDQDYGNFFMNTYELADEDTGPKRFHSPGPTPYPDEDYLENNFAYKGIAVRLDAGDGGVSNGKAWMVFDHDLMRVAGGWSGEGFIDWKAILLNDEHETFPRNIGELHFETPVAPGFANPQNKSFDDPRFTARDGRQFGPLPKQWANYKGLYQYEGRSILSYTVGSTAILEELGMVEKSDDIFFTRNLDLGQQAKEIKMVLAEAPAQAAIIADRGTIGEEEGKLILTIPPGVPQVMKLVIGSAVIKDFNKKIEGISAGEPLNTFTKGGKALYADQILSSPITPGQEEGPFAVDVMMPPFNNPWSCRMKLSGLDFMADPNIAVACATDGDIWKIIGLTEGNGQLKWQRIGAGLFQPLGIKVINEEIFVTCRDQLVRLQDFNGDGETDFYESFNHDHQVSDHFHEFAMGLQADAEGNLYYAKSGRHAREALIPQHGTLLKVSKDGKQTEMLAKGFRAANGVCINPDGSFIVTDQQGYWNPMNRINWIEGKGRFYGNMWGYDPPRDSSRAGMEPPMVWVDMEFDRSPSELTWVDSEAWGPLNGQLLSFSYGYGIIQLVLHERVNGQMQGGVVTLPGIKFMTGVMRGRFNPRDGHLYACGMSAWATNQMMKGGGLYRIRYTGKPLTVPLGLQVQSDGVILTFEDQLDPSTVADMANFEVKTWDIKRSQRYGSDRYNIQTLSIDKTALLANGEEVKIFLPDIKPVDIMTISYKVKDAKGNNLEGILQNTIHNLGTPKNQQLSLK